MGVDLIVNFNTQVIYAGIVFLISLLIFTGHIWIKQRQLECVATQQKKDGIADIESS